MKLSFEKISALVCGTEYTYEKDNAVCFSRFTPEESDFYAKRDSVFALKATASSGIKFRFATNSEKMFIRVRHRCAVPGRTYFSYDCFVNGKITDSLKNFDELLLPPSYADKQYAASENAEKCFSLGSGKKEVTLYLPWNYAVEIVELALDDGATAEPVRRDTFLLFGDSITQGYDAVHTSNRYGSLISEMLGIDEVNKAIGGEVFVPGLAELKSALNHRLIISAYGTNNFAGSFGVEKASSLCRDFYKNLAAAYPDKIIFAVSPIWRNDLYERWKLNDFSPLEDAMENIIKPYGNIHFVRGYDFIPHNTSFFGDLTLHPNDKGFKLYASALCSAVKTVLN